MTAESCIRLVLGQLNLVVGDLDGNETKICSAIEEARRIEADLVLLPELAVTGYPPEDLLLKDDFLVGSRTALERIARQVAGTVAVVGFPERDGDGKLYNAAAVLADGKVHGTYRKVHLPNYGVFDERRYFEASSVGGLLELPGGTTLGLTVCEDAWVEGFPVYEEVAAGAQLLINLSASPYHAGKAQQRETMFRRLAEQHGVALAFCNLVGGQDELVFDGASLVVDSRGKVVARAKQFEEQLLSVDLVVPSDKSSRQSAPPSKTVELLPSLTDRSAPVVSDQTTAAQREVNRLSDLNGSITALLEQEAEIYEALKLGLHDYVAKNGFNHVVLGLSGGIDSALVACIAADALGQDALSLVVMPSPHSSRETQADARLLAQNLGVEPIELPIGQAMNSYGELLADIFADLPSDITEENIQARIRGNLLMALSNKFGWLVLTTGNKSELAVGYSTLYGDAAGGFAVIKDCPKTLVYRLAEYRSRSTDDLGESLIPRSIIDREPSAELSPGQRDSDSLPPYPLLDRIIEGYVEHDLSRSQLLAQRLPEQQVDLAMKLIDRSEYKRRQYPPGVKITPKAFGRDRRMPITNRYGR